LQRAIYSQFQTLHIPFGKTAKLEVALICSEEPRSLLELTSLMSLEPQVMAGAEVTALVSLEPLVMAEAEVMALVALKMQVMAEPEVTALVALEPQVMAEPEVTALVALEPQVMAEPEVTDLVALVPQVMVEPDKDTATLSKYFAQSFTAQDKLYDSLSDFLTPNNT
jgi:hypothetical protein